MDGNNWCSKVLDSVCADDWKLQVFLKLVEGTESSFQEIYASVLVDEELEVRSTDE